MSEIIKQKLHGKTKYPFKHLLNVGDKFITDKPKNNVMTSYRVYKDKLNITCSFVAYEDGTIIVTRTS